MQKVSPSPKPPPFSKTPTKGLGVFGKWFCLLLLVKLAGRRAGRNGTFRKRKKESKFLLSFFMSNPRNAGRRGATIMLPETIDKTVFKKQKIHFFKVFLEGWGSLRGRETLFFQKRVSRPLKVFPLPTFHKWHSKYGIWRGRWWRAVRGSGGKTSCRRLCPGYSGGYRFRRGAGPAPEK